YTIGPERTLAEAAAEARRLGVTGLVVVDPERRPVGILTARDMRADAGQAGREGAHARATLNDTVASAMTPAERLVTARPGIDLDEARKLLDRHRIEKLPLVGDDGRLAGLITLRDIGLRDRWPQATRDSQGRLRGAAAGGGRGGHLAPRRPPQRRGQGVEGARAAGRGRGRQRGHRRGLPGPGRGWRRRGQGRHRPRVRPHHPAGRPRGGASPSSPRSWTAPWWPGSWTSP